MSNFWLKNRPNFSFLAFLSLSLYLFRGTKKQSLISPRLDVSIAHYLWLCASHSNFPFLSFFLWELRHDRNTFLKSLSCSSSSYLNVPMPWCFCQAPPPQPFFGWADSDQFITLYILFHSILSFSFDLYESLTMEKEAGRETLYLIWPRDSISLGFSGRWAFVFFNFHTANEFCPLWNNEISIRTAEEEEISRLKMKAMQNMTAIWTEVWAQRVVMKISV